MAKSPKGSNGPGTTSPSPEMAAPTFVPVPKMGDGAGQLALEQQGIPEGARAGRCAILGRPNVGKSTLLNHLLGQKLVIATPKPGTTRTSVLGVYASAEPPTQIAFVDTPGVLRPKTPLHRVLVDEAVTGLADADIILLMTDIPERINGELRMHPGDQSAIEMAKASGKPVFLAVNKVDRLKQKHLMLPLLEAWSAAIDLKAVIPISARKGINTAELVSELRNELPEGLLYEADFLTDRPERFFAAELVREAVLRHTNKEVPYGTAVLIDAYEEEPSIVRIHATIIVEKASHKGIVIGAGGERLKTMGTEARQQIENMVGRKVFLRLWVKVMEGWTGHADKARKLAASEEL